MRIYHGNSGIVWAGDQRVEPYESGLLKVTQTASIRADRKAQAVQLLRAGLPMPDCPLALDGVKITEANRADDRDGFTNFTVEGHGRAAIAADSNPAYGNVVGKTDVVLTWYETWADGKIHFEHRVVTSNIVKFVVPKNGRIQGVTEAARHKIGYRDVTKDFYSVSVAQIKRDNYGEFDEITVTYSVSVGEEDK